MSIYIYIYIYFIVFFYSDVEQATGWVALH